jgi:hypothetical protein
VWHAVLELDYERGLHAVGPVDKAVGRVAVVWLTRAEHVVKAYLQAGADNQRGQQWAAGS